MLHSATKHNIKAKMSLFISANCCLSLIYYKMVNKFRNFITI